MAIAHCDSKESLEHMAVNFTTSQTNFGSLETVELERGGQERKVTLSNRDEFVRKFCQWHLNGIHIHANVKEQEGLRLIIQQSIRVIFCLFHAIQNI